MKMLTVAAGLLILTVAVHAPAPATAALMDEDPLQAQVRAIALTLRCVVCQTESLWESKSETARQMREVIRERLTQGQSPDEVRAYFVSRYGDYILLAPRKTGVNWLLWAGPFTALALGGFFLYRTLRRWVAQTTAREQERLVPLAPQARQRIEQARREEHP